MEDRNEMGKMEENPFGDGGFGLADDSVRHFTQYDPLYKKERKEWLKLYIPARSAVVLRKVKVKK